MDDLESRVQETGRRIFSMIEERRPSKLSLSYWENKTIEKCMGDDDFKTRLLRFIDVYPVLKAPTDVIGHVDEYLGEADGLVKQGIDVSRRYRLDRMTSFVIMKLAGRMAGRFISGADAEEAAREAAKLQKRGSGSILNLVGDKTLSEHEADLYMDHYVGLIDHLDAGSQVSLKLVSLYSQFDPVDTSGSVHAIKHRLRNIFAKARDAGVIPTIDAETYDSLEITDLVFREMVEEFGRMYAGIVVQAYLKDSEERLDEIIQWAESGKHHIKVRLVKGAYWDYEVIHATQLGWDIPVFTNKLETDVSFERLTRKLLEHGDYVTTAIGSHNVRSIANAIVMADDLGVLDKLELQVLYGMGDHIKEGLTRLGHKTDVYLPYGEMIPAMGYLVRRILENTSNESFLRSFQSDVDPDRLLKTPYDGLTRQNGQPAKTVPKTRADADLFRNEPLTDFSVRNNRSRITARIDSVELGDNYPLLINGRKVYTDDRIVSENPSDVSEIVGLVSKAKKEHVDMAVEAALSAVRKRPYVEPEKNAQCLFNVAQQMRDDKDDLTSLLMKESGKIQKEADAGIAEGIDFPKFYGRDMLRLGRGYTTEDVPGETNEIRYKPRGVVAIISPWNFPFAILAGMTSAAVAAGNSVIIKPASNTPVIGYRVAEMFNKAGFPEGTVNFLPGSGSEIGDYLVSHPDVSMIAFTGSKEVGVHMNQLAAQSGSEMKRVIAELGGKNAIIVDTSADIDDSIIGTSGSAFGFSGQKCSACSRVIVVDGVYDIFVGRLVDAVKSIKVGPAELPGTLVGPVISAEQKRKIEEYIRIGRKEARLAYQADQLDLNGHYVSPAVFVDVDPDSRIAQEEIFGPVLSVIRAKDFDHAMQIANDVEYGLTAGIYSRTPSHISQFMAEIEAGNVYVNKKITGALVGRQPFGVGYKMSGLGYKAGGIDYLRQFMRQVSFSENTMRHGFAPLKTLDLGQEF